MKIFNAGQIREIDQSTITEAGISGAELMERAARACADRIVALCPVRDLHLYCGMGNNGGDGLAIARLLSENNFACTVYVVHFRDNFSPDAELNLKRLESQGKARILHIRDEKDLDDAKAQGVCAVDALLGTGAQAVKEGLLASCIKAINGKYSTIFSIDLPSGLVADEEQKSRAIVKATITLTFQFPKLCLLLPENGDYSGEFEVLDIGLSETAIAKHESLFQYVTEADVRSLLSPRKKFSHKGSYGHALLLAGSQGKSGAALLAAEGVLRAGAGLLTVHSVQSVIQAMAVRLPEAMSSEDENSAVITEVHKPENYDAIGFGPGTGQDEDTANVLKMILHHGVSRLVIDADGLNILAENKTWLEFLPPAAILTPHPKEFERLAGKSDGDLDRLKNLKQFSARYNCIVVLKGAHTCIAMPDGNLFFNSTGNSGLAKGGTGDTLTGIILGLLTSGYNAPKSALIGTFVHGLAADLAAKKIAQESMLATDILRALPEAFKVMAGTRHFHC